MIHLIMQQSRRVVLAAPVMIKSMISFEINFQ